VNRDTPRGRSGGVHIPDAKLDRWQEFKINALAEREALAEFARFS
jgi:hypothetical protein